jgi:peptidoglycan/xylan/chitin deacetylase (PgdA/CDA1 family)
LQIATFERIETAETRMLQYSYRPNFPQTQQTRTNVDQGWIDYLPITLRPQLIWPNGARTAVMICPNVLYYELTSPHDPWINPWTRMTPDVMMHGRQEFGARVGFWRITEVLDRYNIPCTAVLNTSALQKYTDICDAIVARKWDILGHGISNTRFICGMSEEEERAYYLEMRRIVRDLTGIEMAGMGGPGPQAATENTPDLLAETGFLYYADLFHDDQPFPLNVRSGRLISMPYSIEVNDVPVFSAASEGEEFVTIVRRQFDRLHTEGGRVMCMAIHPSVAGQAQRAKYVDEALRYLTSQSGVWFATGREIAEQYLANAYDAVAARIAQSKAVTR